MSHTLIYLRDKNFCFRDQPVWRPKAEVALDFPRTEEATREAWLWVTMHHSLAVLDRESEVSRRERM